MSTQYMLTNADITRNPLQKEICFLAVLASSLWKPTPRTFDHFLDVRFSPLCTDVPVHNKVDLFKYNQLSKINLE